MTSVIWWLTEVNADVSDADQEADLDVSLIINISLFWKWSYADIFNICSLEFLTNANHYVQEFGLEP